jgi:uncharacterized phiE125 gp8 family phage protein
MRGVGTITVTQEPRAEPLSLAEAKAHLRDPANEDALISSLAVAARQHVEAFLQRPLVLQTVELAFDCFHDVFRLDRSPILKFGSVQYRDSAGALQTLATTVYQVDSRSEPGRLTRAYAQVWPQIRGGEDLHSVLITYQAGYLAPVNAVEITANTLEVKDNPFVNGDKIYASHSGGGIPAGLVENVPYYVVETAGEVFKVSLTQGGAAVDITSAGSGTVFLSKSKFPQPIKQAMLLMLAHWFENREEVITGTIVARIPSGARALLAPYRMQAFA